MDNPHISTNPNGGSCGTFLTNAAKLPDDLQIFPEPTDSLVTSWFQGSVTLLTPTRTLTLTTS